MLLGHSLREAKSGEVFREVSVCFFCSSCLTVFLCRTLREIVGKECVVPALCSLCLEHSLCPLLTALLTSLLEALMAQLQHQNEEEEEEEWREGLQCLLEALLEQLQLEEETVYALIR